MTTESIPAVALVWKDRGHWNGPRVCIVADGRMYAPDDTQCTASRLFVAYQSRSTNSRETTQKYCVFTRLFKPADHSKNFLEARNAYDVTCIWAEEEGLDALDATLAALFERHHANT